MIFLSIDHRGLQEQRPGAACSSWWGGGGGMHSS